VASSGPEWELVVSDSLAAGLAALDAQSFDLALLDLDLPDSRGLDGLRKILDCASDVPIIVVTGDDEGRTGIGALQLGAQDYLVTGSTHPTAILRAMRFAIERNAILERLKETDRLKSEFVSAAAHEVRTPLAITREFVSLVHDGVAGPITPAQADYLETALRNCDRLANVLTNLAELARMDAGLTRLSPGGCALDVELARWVADWAPDIAAKKQTLSLEVVDEPWPPMVCDADKIHRVVVNLIGNAHKFTEEGGRIVVRARRADGAVILEVEDTGIGIASEDQPHVFDAFVQIRSYEGSGAKGKGLGLAIAKRIVELHGGSIFLTSKPGCGSTFTVTIPLGPA
jgi:signal transduction histidine kinase